MGVAALAAGSAAEPVTSCRDPAQAVDPVCRRVPLGATGGRLVPTGRKRTARPAFKPGTTFVVGLTLASTGSLQCVRATQGPAPNPIPGRCGSVASRGPSHPFLDLSAL